MKNKFIAVILALTLACSSAILLSAASDIMLGDVTEDGKISAQDARITLRASASLDVLSDTQKVAADVNFDAKISAADARTILRAASKLESLPELPTEEESSEEITSEIESETETTEPTPEVDVVVEEYPEAIDAFFSGNFYLDASMDSDDELMNFKMAINKFGTEIIMDSEDAQLSLFLKKNATYLKIKTTENKKYYIELSSLLSESFGIDLNEIIDELSFIEIEDAGLPVLTKGEYNGEECYIYTFSNDTGSNMLFYVIDEKVVKITVTEAEGAEETNIIVNELSENIPSDMLTVSGYTETSILALPSILPGFME